MSRAAGVRSVPRGERPISRTGVLWLAALVLLVVGLYAPVRHYPFISLDDQLYVSENSQIAAGLTWAGVKWVFTAVHGGNWHPVTGLSHMADVELFGLDPGWHHLINVLFHLLSTLLLFLFLREATGDWGSSLFVAAVFAVHPLRVESVAWISERKDVLSAFLLMLTLWAYVRYVQRRSAAWYATALACAALGLMAKPMLVSLPLLLLLLDVWPLSRTPLPLQSARTSQGEAPVDWSRLLWEKVPFFLLALTVGLITFLVQRSVGAVAPLDVVPLMTRAGNALVAYGAYIWKMAWPLHLGLFYPLRPVLPAWQVAVSALSLAGITAFVVLFGRRQPCLAVGWAWYLITLVPVIGLVQVGGQAMADRYTYVPQVGLYIMIGWAVPRALPLGFRRFLPIAAVVFVVALSALTREQVRVWRDDETLWRHTLAVAPDSYVALNHLGKLLYARGQVVEAADDFAAAVRLSPTYADAHNNLGNLLMQRGQIDEAIRHYEAANRTAPMVAGQHSNLGLALAEAGRTTEAVAELRTALRINPDMAEAHAALGNILAEQGSLEDAQREFRQALALKPALPDVRHLLGLSLAASGRLDEAISEYRDALRFEPGSAPLLTDLGVALAKQGNPAEAVTYLTRAVQISPGAEAPHFHLGLALAAIGRQDEAAAEFEQVLRLNPAHDAARGALAAARRR